MIACRSRREHGLFSLWTVLSIVAVAGQAAELRNITVSGYGVSDEPMYQCLWLLGDRLRQESGNGPIFVLESAETFFENKAIHMAGGGLEIRPIPNTYYNSLSVSAGQANLEELLNLLVAGDPKFAWEYDPGNNVVNVIDRRLKESPLWFLNAVVKDATFAQGEGMAALERIGRKSGIRFYGVRTLRGERPLSLEYVFAGPDFRSAVNWALAHIAPPDQHFFLITCVPEPRGELTEEWAASAHAYFYGGLRRGFEEFVTKHRQETE